MEEKLSLVHRFGVTISFSKPSQKEYYAIVTALARRAGITIPIIAGIMPVLKDQAPELYNRIDDVVRSKIFDFLVEDGILQGYIEFDEDELHRNFENDMEDGTFEFIASDYFDIGEQPDEDSLKEKAYDIWYESEMSIIDSEDLDRIRSRYSVDDHVTMEDNPDYTVDIPVDFLPD